MYGRFQQVMWQVFLMAVLYLNYLTAECNVCQKNQVACINSTSFYLCFGDNEPNLDTLYHCQNGFDCTDLSAICVQASSQRPPSCGDTSLCGMCSAHRNYLFACLSRTTFQMCYGAIRPTGQIGYCPPGYVCHADSDAICVLKHRVDSVTCDIVDDSTSGGSSMTPFPPNLSTTTSTSTYSTTTKPTSELLTPLQVCEQKNTTGLYPTIPNDPNCKRYIHCYFSNGFIQGIEYNCSSQTYFHIQQQQCVFNEPSYCLQ